MYTNIVIEVIFDLHWHQLTRTKEILKSDVVYSKRVSVLMFQKHWAFTFDSNYTQIRILPPKVRRHGFSYNKVK